MPPLALRCDNCGAPLRPAANLPTVECEHCGRVILLAPTAAPAAARAGSRAGIVGAAVLGLCGVAAIGVAARGGEARPAAAHTTVVSTSMTTSTSSSVTVKVEAPKPAPPAPPWREVARFGAPGTGAGQLDEARHIAVAPDGRVFVAEGRTGRVHRFDAAGRFEALAVLEPAKLDRQAAIFGLAADRDGRAWVNRGGDLVQLAADGSVARTVAGDYPETYFHGAVALDAGGAVYAVTDRTGRYDVVKLSPAGKIVARKKNTGARELAASGLGGLVLARSFDHGVDVLAPDGALRSRFGQLGSPGAVAIDPRGRIFVEDGGKLAVFDPDGRRAATLDVPPFVDFAIDGASFIYLLSRERVLKIELIP